MDAPAKLFLIFGFVCMIFSVFPLPIRADLDPTLARIALAVAVTLLIAGLIDFFVGFIGGWKRSANRRRPRS